MARYAPVGDMLGELSRNWWVVVLRGLIVALLGLLVVVWVQVLPEETALVVLAVVFGLLALADGLALGWVAFAPGRVCVFPSWSGRSWVFCWACSPSSPPCSWGSP